MTGTIIIATHKQYDFPKSKIYLPLFVGEGKKVCNNGTCDDTGDNISEKNPLYCELTALYWAWKNVDSDYIGLVHYRRYLTLCKNAKDLNFVLNGEDIEKLLNTYDVILPQKTKYASSLKGHYVNSKKGYKKTHTKDIDLTRQAIEKLYPEYLSSFDEVLNGHSASMCNMFIMKKEEFNEYSKWLFEIIFEMVKNNTQRIDQKRYAGAISEFLINVWVKKRNLKVKYVNLLETEKVGFIKKAIRRIKCRI